MAGRADAAAALTRVPGPQSTATDANAAMWRFFQAHSLR
jgi:hypothetical protein